MSKDYKYKLNYGPHVLQKSYDINDLIEEELEKGWKITTRNGERFYADGPHQGKKVGSIRGKGKKQESESKPSKKDGGESIMDILKDPNLANKMHTPKNLGISKETFKRAEEARYSMEDAALDSLGAAGGDVSQKKKAFLMAQAERRKAQAMSDYWGIISEESKNPEHEAEWKKANAKYIKASKKESRFQSDL